MPCAAKALETCSSSCLYPMNISFVSPPSAISSKKFHKVKENKHLKLIMLE